MNKINWYPWLNYAYKHIIITHQKKQGHHALLLHANYGMGSNSLIYAISRWLMCQKPENIKSCNKCHNCQLMVSNTHPDWYKIIADKTNNSIGIEDIRYLINNLLNYAQQDNKKIIWFPKIELLTEAASNALLKILEEPTNNTYFLLECEEINLVLTTLRSRCFYYYLSIPEYKVTISWLKKQNVSLIDFDIKTAIKLNEGAPIATLSLLKSNIWFKRKQFCQLLIQNLSTKLILNWLPELNQIDVKFRINWLISLLLDAVKYKQQIKKYFINQDQLELIIKLANLSSTKILLKNITEWQNCRYKLISSIGLNQEFQLISQLITWKKSFYHYN